MKETNCLEHLANKVKTLFLENLPKLPEKFQKSQLFRLNLDQRSGKLSGNAVTPGRKEPVQ